jgi:small subunit ribosomal protein S15
VTTLSDRTTELVAQFGKGEGDTGAAPVQIAILTERIRSLTEHLRTSPRDFGSRRGLLRLIGKRRRLQAYYQRNNPAAYAALIQKLGLRR